MNSPPRNPAPPITARPGSEAASPPASKPAQSEWLLLLSIFLIVIGARFWLVQNYTCAIPFWDQWGAEGRLLLKPWLEHQLHFGELFAPHNEHRIILTRLIALGLFVLNGQWDAQLEMAFNAVLCGVIAVLMTRMFWATFGSRWRWVVALSVTLLFGLPFSWENTLAGFQNQFYLLLILSLGTIWGLGSHRPRTGALWVGFISAPLALCTMASGFMAATAVLVFDGLRLARKREPLTASRYLTWVWCLIITCIGWKSRTAIVGHDDLKAESIAAFIRAFARCLSWPFVSVPAAMWVMFAPLGLLALIYAWNPKAWPERAQQGVEFVLNIAAWIVVQAAAIAYARGGHDQPPASRYMDLLALGALMNLFALLLLLSRLGAFPASKFRGLAAGAGLAWICLLLFGLVQITNGDFAIEMPNRRTILQTEEENVRGYVATGDYQRYIANKPPLDLPYPDVPTLVTLLDDPTIRKILPADIRAPLPIVRKDDASLDSGFVPGGYYPITGASTYPTTTWGSYTASGDAAQGGFRGELDKPSKTQYLRFQFAGFLGQADLSFVLRDRDTDRRVDFHPGKVPREHWRSEYLPAPGHRFEIIASDRSAKTWFAFAGASEVAGLSYWTGYLLRRGSILFTAGILLFGLLPVFQWLASMTTRAEGEVE